LRSAAKKAKSVDVIDAAIQENVRNVYKEILTKSPILKELIHDGKLKVVLALYYLDSGAVKFLNSAGNHSSSH
jgi:uncharacterized pyridoxamine 5'-phosphate oxidase family protein